MVRAGEGEVDRALFHERIAEAFALRRRVVPAGTTGYRLLNAEGDFLPSWTVDRFGDTLVSQITSAGLERLRDEAYAALIDVLARDANGRNELDEPNLSAAKQATVVALARAGAMERAFDLATTIGYQPDAAFVALYEVLASQGATVSRLKQ